MTLGRCCAGTVLSATIACGGPTTPTTPTGPSAPPPSSLTSNRQIGTHPSLTVESVTPSAYVWPPRTPASMPVSAGTEVIANIEIPANFSTRESFTLTTAMAFAMTEAR